MSRRKSNKSFVVGWKLSNGKVACTRRVHAMEAILIWSRMTLGGTECHLANVSQAKMWGWMVDGELTYEQSKVAYKFDKDAIIYKDQLRTLRDFVAYECGEKEGY